MWETVAGGDGGNDRMPRGCGSRPRTEQVRIEKGWPRKKLEKRLAKSEKQRGKKTRDGKVSN